MHDDGAERIVFRGPLPEGFRVETGVLSSLQNLQVHYRPANWARGEHWFGRNRDSSLGAWSLAVPEMIGTADGFVFGFDLPARWQRAPGQAIHYHAESRPLTPAFDRACFAGPDHLIDRTALVGYDARIRVEPHLLEIQLAITNLGPATTSFFTHLCNRFHDRGLVWGWRDRTYVQVENEWRLAAALLAGDGYPAGRHWFLRPNLLGDRFREMFRPDAAHDPRSRVITSPYLVMQMEDPRHTTIYGSPLPLGQGKVHPVDRAHHPVAGVEPGLEPLHPQQPNLSVGDVVVPGVSRGVRHRSL